jgi:hypothetical protein
VWLIHDSLWELKTRQNEHPGIVLSLAPQHFPVVTVLCSSMDVGLDEVFIDAPVPAFAAGTRIYFRNAQHFEPRLFSGLDPKVRYRGQLSAQDLTVIQTAYAGFYNAGLLTGKSKL